MSLEEIKEFLHVKETLDLIGESSAHTPTIQDLIQLERERKLIPLLYAQTSFQLYSAIEAGVTNMPESYYHITAYFTPYEFNLLDNCITDNDTLIISLSHQSYFIVKKILYPSDHRLDVLIGEIGEICDPLKKSPIMVEEYLQISRFALDDIFYTKTDVNAFINNLSKGQKNRDEITILKEKNNELNKTIENLQVKLANIKTDLLSENSRNQDQKIIALLAIVLSETQKKYKNGEKPNYSQIEDSILNLVQRLKVDEMHKHGLKSPSKRISACYQEFSEYFDTAPKLHSQ